MLDLQRRKSAYQNKHSVFFARGVIFAHLVVGGALLVALVFHELFAFTMLALGWYVFSVLLIALMTWHQQWARIGLGLWFLVGAIGALAYLAWWLPAAEKLGTPGEAPVKLSMRILPLWLSTIAIGYAASGIVLMVSRRIVRATARGFDLWDVPRV